MNPSIEFTLREEIKNKKLRDIEAWPNRLGFGNFGRKLDRLKCHIAARKHGFEPADIHGFVTMVPMMDAEIVRL